MLDQHQLIADLEAEIEDLRDSAERCRKIDMGAKAAMGVGVAMLLVRFFWFSASALVIGIAAAWDRLRSWARIVAHSARSSPA